MKKKLLGERLLEAGLIRERELAQALQAQQSTGEQLGRLLVRLGYLTEDDLLRLLCEDVGIEFSDLQGRLPDAEAVALVSEALARARTVLPLAVADGTLTIALADPFDAATISAVERSSGQRVVVIAAPRSRIQEMIEGAYRAAVGAPTPEQARSTGWSRAPGRPPSADGAGAEPAASDATRESIRDPQDLSVTGGGAADEVFQRGIALGATDIHVEPTADGVDVRYRLDGILRRGPSFPKSMQGPLLTRIKVLAGLNIAENRLPQDGRLRITSAGREVDLRVSTFPTIHGEDLVLRILDRGRVALDLAHLGITESDTWLFREVLARPLGLVLITGPTGSGKTTTLYSALAEMNTGERCILTIEDPVEYELHGVRQSQINLRANLTFATGLRAMLRHDPDVILVGEIRDVDTAEIALSAAMTGHLVLSTIHTNSAAAAIPRLLEMGTEPFALASSLQLVVAQRLVRVLCKECRQPGEVPMPVRRKFNLEHAQLFRSVGCAACGETGYRGRVAIFEILPSTDAIIGAIYDRMTAEAIQRLGGRPTLMDAGIEKVRAGQTTLEELLRVISV